MGLTQHLLLILANWQKMADKKSVSVVHLTPHAGGGVGTVLRAILKTSSSWKRFSHTIVALEPLNASMKEWCIANNIGFLENGWYQQAELCKFLEECDIVHIHWWNHPLLHAYLAFSALPKMRTVLWSHVNGLFVPQVFFQSLLYFPDFFVIATPYSMESPLIVDGEMRATGKIKTIQSNAGIPEGAPTEIVKPDIFRAGYIGTVDYSKMHRDFISIWSATSIPDPPLVVCGGPSEKDFRKEVSRRGVAHLFDIRGIVDNVPEVLSTLHVLAYPLTNTHYGTGEQVLLEAMAYGTVPVVMDNGCESFLVKDGETGIVASGKDDFVKAVKFLKSNPAARQEMAERGRKYVASRFEIGKTVQQWHDLYEDVLKLDKREHHLKLHSFADLSEKSATTLMLTSYGDSIQTQKILSLLTDGLPEKGGALDELPPTCYTKTRGSPFHYRELLPGDHVLDKICHFLEECCA